MIHPNVTIFGSEVTDHHGSNNAVLSSTMRQIRVFQIDGDESGGDHPSAQ
jgi:hypothetical protein